MPNTLQMFAFFPCLSSVSPAECFRRLEFSRFLCPRTQGSAWCIFPKSHFCSWLAGFQLLVPDSPEGFSPVFGNLLSWERLALTSPRNKLHQGIWGMRLRLPGPSEEMWQWRVLSECLYTMPPTPPSCQLDIYRHPLLLFSAPHPCSPHPPCGSFCFLEVFASASASGQSLLISRS